MSGENLHLLGLGALVQAMRGLAVYAHSPQGAGEQVVDVTLRDFEVIAQPSTVSAGRVTFRIRNEGPSVHELYVVRSDQPPGNLPTVAGGKIKKESTNLVAEQPPFDPGSTKTLTVNLSPGQYVLLCNVGHHYQAGMYTRFIVA